MPPSNRPHGFSKETGKNIPLILMVVVFLGMLLLAAHLGSADIDVFSILYQAISGSHAKSYEMQSYIFFQVRMPRIILCALAGMTLGMSGCVMQSILRNPLASPFTLGVSNGASFGAAVAMVLGANLTGVNHLFKGYSIVAGNAFLFGCLSLLIVCSVAKLCQNNLTVLILTGTAVSSLFSAGVSILKYLSNAEALKNLDIWLMGGFWGANWKAVITILPAFLISSVVILCFSWDLNALNAGEDIARTMGVNVKAIKTVSMILVTLMASLSIAFCGVIGFIGLVSPHIARSLVGVDNRRLVPASALLGAIVLLISDTIGRTIISPKEIPVGIITSLIGVPFFVLILAQKKKQLWSE